MDLLDQIKNNQSIKSQINKCCFGQNFYEKKALNFYYKSYVDRGLKN